MSAFRHVADFRGNSRFRTWLARIVTNQCLLQLRAPERRWTDLEGLYHEGEVRMPASRLWTPRPRCWASRSALPWRTLPHGCQNLYARHSIFMQALA
ncbi:MAG: hypothetical protein ABSF64_37220 [Bryobacteraceae bacterium]